MQTLDSEQSHLECIFYRTTFRIQKMLTWQHFALRMRTCEHLPMKYKGNKIFKEAEGALIH